MNKYHLDKKINIIRRKISGEVYNLSDKIFIFDVFCGLCNQMLDIHLGINYCLKNNIRFTFRYASFRKDDLTTFYNVNFEDLFDKSFLNQFDLYVDINTLDLNAQNTYNYNSVLHAPHMLKYNIKYLQYIKQPYIAIRGIFTLILDTPIIINIYPLILPSPKIMIIYNDICTNLKLDDDKFNFLHYRYERDFVIGHQLNDIQTLGSIINKVTFKNDNYEIYIASSNIKNLLNTVNTNKKIIFKNEDALESLNFEERAFIDFMIGKKSVEIYGHPRSSFSGVLNILKNTNNYY